MLKITPNSLDTIFVDTDFNYTLSVTENGRKIKIVSVQMDPNIQKHVSIEYTNETVNISGSYPVDSLFPRPTIKCITKDKSDKHEDPLVVDSFELIPSDKKIISYRPTAESTKTIKYTIYSANDSGFITQDVEYNYSKNQEILKGYL